MVQISCCLCFPLTCKQKIKKAKSNSCLDLNHHTLLFFRKKTKTQLACCWRAAPSGAGRGMQMRRRQRFLRGGSRGVAAPLVSLHPHVPVMTAIIGREDRTLIERRGKKRKVCAGAKESTRSLIWNVAPCELHVNQAAASLLARKCAIFF